MEQANGFYYDSTAQCIDASGDHVLCEGTVSNYDSFGLPNKDSSKPSKDFSNSLPKVKTES